MSELVGHHNGEVLVEMYDWVSWLEKVFKKFDGILKIQNSNSAAKSLAKLTATKL